MNCSYLQSLGFSQYNKGVLFSKPLSEQADLWYNIHDGTVALGDNDKLIYLPHKYYAKELFDELHRILCPDMPTELTG